MKKLKIFIQININNEKSGISPDELEEFYNVCTSKLDLDIVGLMCIPPNDEKVLNIFQ